VSNTEETDEFYLEIFISHDKSPLWQEVADFIELKMQHQVAALNELPESGATNLALLDEITDECSFAVVVALANDSRSRENLIHEIGFYQGKFGCENVLVLRQDGTADFPSISGIVSEVFKGTDIKTTFGRIQKEIEAAIVRFESDEEDEDDD